jgi:hypothetical protein
MICQVLQLFWCRGNHVEPFAIERGRCIRCTLFALTSDPGKKSLAGEFDVILNTVSADHDYNEY